MMMAIHTRIAISNDDVVNNEVGQKDMQATSMLFISATPTGDHILRLNC